MTAGSRVKLDLNSPEFQDVFFRLELVELKQVVSSLGRLRELDWNAVSSHTGFKWEAVRHIRTPNAATAYSIRLSEKIRAIAYRDAGFLRIISLKTLRDEMRLSPGDTLDLTVTGDEVTLRPRRGATPLQKERGVWVFRTGKPLTADETAETLRSIRAQRQRRNAGERQ